MDRDKWINNGAYREKMLKKHKQLIEKSKSDNDRMFESIRKNLQDIKEMVQEYTDYGCLSDTWLESEQKPKPLLRVIQGGTV